jgi:hypothetical protein
MEKSQNPVMGESYNKTEMMEVCRKSRVLKQWVSKPNLWASSKRAKLTKEERSSKKERLN